EGIELTVAVNLFGRDLLDLGLPHEVEELLARWRIPADQLELEIAENTILTEPERARTILERLGESGVTLAIDDFGSGYTSFHYLKRLPVDVLKIDRSFVQAMNASGRDAIIVRSTVELGQNLGLVVVAEGVESEEIWNRLAASGCDRVQGYFLSRPMPASGVAPWIRAREQQRSLPPPHAAAI
ncbi:MAG TPA: EAL domain-containing protein, partial [Actinomycetota bacterium]|nr:EAL domain-containing protein [Actinomycetota bacterium]